MKDRIMVKKYLSILWFPIKNERKKIGFMVKIRHAYQISNRQNQLQLILYDWSHTEKETPQKEIEYD